MPDKRIRAEFLEMPDMSLTVEQAERLFGLPRAVCQAVLDALVDAQFLRRKSNGVYARLTDADASRRRRVSGRPMPD